MTGFPILITGGAGLLGVHWAVACRGIHSVNLVLHKRPILLSGVSTSQINLADAKELKSRIKDANIQCVINTAGLTSVERCELDPDMAYYCNVTLAKTIASAAAQLGVSLIHISTDHLFDGANSTYDEESAVTPINVYGRTKAVAEEEVLRAHPDALILRTNFYGWGPSYRKSFSDWLIEGMRSGGRLGLFNDMLYTPTNIIPLIEAAMTLSAKGVSGIVNVAGEDALSKYAFGLRLAQTFELPTDRIEPISMASQTGLVRRPSSMALSTQRLHELIGHSLGGVDQHLRLLRAQEASPDIVEITKL